MENIGLLNKLGIGKYLKKVKEYVDANKPYIKTTYDNLVNLRNNSQLIPGWQYRITDYVTTTAQADTQSAGHQFDVIVTADDESTLNKVARACLHEGDTYFSEAGVKLEAWQIWYCLDNDVNRFAWADEENGKGVIYYMKDEHDNECSYDFKNIQFKRYKITSFTNPDIVNSDTMPLLYAQDSSHGYGYEVDMDDYIYCYTFASNQTDDNEDLSVTQLCDCRLNKFEKHVLDTTVKINLNNNVFFYHEVPEYPSITEISNNYFMHGSHHNTFISAFYGNNIQNYFRYNIGCIYFNNVVRNYVESNLACVYFTTNTLEDSFRHNIIGSKCVGNKFGGSAIDNIIGSDCQANDFGITFQNNVIGSKCFGNKFGVATAHNIIGSDCEANDCGIVFQNNVISSNFSRNNFANNTVGNNFGSNFKYNNCGPFFVTNTFVDNTMYNNFGCSFKTNKFGSKVGINSFGEQCINNTFGGNIVGNTCHSNTRNNIIGSNFTHNIGKFAYSTFGNNVHDDVENGAFITACDFGNSSYFNLLVPSSVSTENYVKNLKLCNVNGTTSAYINIIPPITNQDYELKIAKNSKGEIKIYCEADLIA